MSKDFRQQTRMRGARVAVGQPVTKGLPAREARGGEMPGRGRGKGTDSSQGARGGCGGSGRVLALSDQPKRQN